MNQRPILDYLANSFFLVTIYTKKQLVKIVNNKIISRQNKATTIFYVNAGILYYIFSDRNFYSAFKNVNYCYLNSSVIRLILRFFFRKKAEKLNAEDFIFSLLSLKSMSKKRIYLLGSTCEGNKRAVQVLGSLYPKLVVSGADGYFKSNKSVIRKIQKYRPDILFVGLGSLNQEKWVNANINYLNRVRTIITIGAFIDVLGKQRKLSPVLMKKFGFEWLYRLSLEPGRLWKRYFYGGGVIGLILFWIFYKRVKLFVFNHG